MIILNGEVKKTFYLILLLNPSTLYGKEDNPCDAPGLNEKGALRFAHTPLGKINALKKYPNNCYCKGLESSLSTSTATVRTFSPPPKIIPFSGVTSL